MTRKDYIKAAKIVRVARSYHDASIVAAIADSFMALFQGDNASFDVSRFEEACKPTGDPRLTAQGAIDNHPIRY
jgi:hypothetical protein